MLWIDYRNCEMCFCKICNAVHTPVKALWESLWKIRPIRGAEQFLQSVGCVRSQDNKTVEDDKRLYLEE